jgi:hypothetical protein
MALQWTTRTPERPDRYLDWEVLNVAAFGPSGERWCSVLLQTAKAAGGDPAVHLRQLKLQIESQPPGGPWTIKIHNDELALLNARIVALSNGSYQPSEPDDPGLSFFVYLPESGAYQNGVFADTTYYTIRYVGPHIPGLRINQQNLPAPQAYIHHFKHKAAKPVAVGIIDHALAFANERFRTRYDCMVGDVEKTRVKHIWLQAIERAESNAAHSLTFGRHLDASDIDDALRESATASGVINEDVVYAKTGAIDYSQGFRQATAHRVGHGTHVMDLACGFAPDDPAGEDRPILAVQLPEPATLDTSGVTMSSYVLQGLRQIMLWADKLDQGKAVPLVVNFSYGLYAGPKDGSHVLELEMDRLIRHRNLTTPTALVLPAGNTYRSRVTACLSLAAGEEQSIDWIVLPDGGMPSFLEIWTNATGDNAPIDVSVTPPNGFAGPVAMTANGRAEVLSDADKPICAVYFDARANGVGAVVSKSRIFVAVNPTKAFDRRQPLAPSGCWQVNIKNNSANRVDLDHFIQREETPGHDRPPGRQSYFEHTNAFVWDAATGNYEQLGDAAHPCPISHVCSLSAIADGQESIVVGGAMAPTDGQPATPAKYTSSAPTPARTGPDFAAIVDDSLAFPGALAAGTRSGSVVAQNGTSVAAPQVTRLLAESSASLAELKLRLGVGPGTPRDLRLGLAVVPKGTRSDIPDRRRG